MSTKAKWAIALAASGAAAGALWASIDQGSSARTFLPTRRPSRELPEGFRGDLEFLASAVQRHELGATKDQRARFAAIIAAHQPQTIDELTLAASEALAVFDNAATSLISTSAHRLGVRFGWVADALVIVKTRPELASLAGHRVTRIAGGDPLIVWPLFQRFVGGGTRQWLRNRTAWFFSVPEALRQIGLGSGDGVRIETEAPDGSHHVSVLHAEPQAMAGGPLADFRDRFPGDQGLGTEGWWTALDPQGELPLYLEQWDHLVHTKVLQQEDSSTPVFYLRLISNVAGDEPKATDIEDAIATIRNYEFDRFVVDVRYHSGGDYRVSLPIVRAICERARELGVPIKLLVGPNTVGGGLIAASQYLAHAPERTTVIGNGVGDELRARGQGRTIELPHSGLRVQLCHDWHDVAADTTLWHDVWLPDKFLLQGVGEFVVDQGVQNSWQDYIAGRDLVLEAALAHE